MPRFFCWAAKYPALEPATVLVMSIIRPTISRFRMVRGTLSSSMLTSTLTTVTTLEIIWGMDWLIIWRRVSTSLVYRLMMSPWEWLSK